MSNPRPPRKKAGVATGPRRVDGVLLDVASLARELGMTSKMVRAQVARGQLPHRRLGSRILFRRDEVLTFIDRLPGTTAAEALLNVAARNGTEPAR